MKTRNFIMGYLLPYLWFLMIQLITGFFHLTSFTIFLLILIVSNAILFLSTSGYLIRPEKVSRFHLIQTSKGKWLQCMTAELFSFLSILITYFSIGSEIRIIIPLSVPAVMLFIYANFYPTYSQRRTTGRRNFAVMTGALFLILSQLLGKSHSDGFSTVNIILYTITGVVLTIWLISVPFCYYSHVKKLQYSG